MATYNLVEAGAAVGRTKSAILKAIQRGAISAARDTASGGWAIEPAELHRVFPPISTGSETGETPLNRSATVDTGELRELRAKLDAADEALRFRDEAIRFRDATIDDLRRRLDASDEERRRVVLALSDQRAAPTPIRRWWRFGR